MVKLTSVALDLINLHVSLPLPTTTQSQHRTQTHHFGCNTQNIVLRFVQSDFCFKVIETAHVNVMKAIGFSFGNALATGVIRHHHLSPTQLYLIIGIPFTEARIRMQSTYRQLISNLCFAVAPALAIEQTQYFGSRGVGI